LNEEIRQRVGRLIGGRLVEFEVVPQKRDRRLEIRQS